MHKLRELFLMSKSLELLMNCHNWRLTPLISSKSPKQFWEGLHFLQVESDPILWVQYPLEGMLKIMLGTIALWKRSLREAQNLLLNKIKNKIDNEYRKTLIKMISLPNYRSLNIHTFRTFLIFCELEVI